VAEGGSDLVVKFADVLGGVVARVFEQCCGAWIEVAPCGGDADGLDGVGRRRWRLVEVFGAGFLPAVQRVGDEGCCAGGPFGGCPYSRVGAALPAAVRRAGAGMLAVSLIQSRISQ